MATKSWNRNALTGIVEGVRYEPGPRGSGLDLPADAGFVAFYRAEYPGAVRLAFVLSCSAEIAEDVTQEAFARLYHRFATLDHPPAYLRVTIVNLVRETQRGQSRLQRHTNRIRTDPPQLLGASELMDVLARLPPRARTVLVLRYWADWTEHDIAAALRCRPGTVKSIASRALARLEKELEP